MINVKNSFPIHLGESWRGRLTCYSVLILLIRWTRAFGSFRKTHYCFPGGRISERSTVHQIKTENIRVWGIIIEQLDQHFSHLKNRSFPLCHIFLCSVRLNKISSTRYKQSELVEMLSNKSKSHNFHICKLNNNGRVSVDLKLCGTTRIYFQLRWIKNRNT